MYLKGRGTKKERRKSVPTYFSNRSCIRQRPEIARLRGEKRASSVRDLTVSEVTSEDAIRDASKNCRDVNWHSRLWLQTDQSGRIA